MMFAALSVLTGLVYPVLITALAQLIFPEQATGSLIRKNGQVVGSRLIGQQFEDPHYFWGRPSATTPPYNASASSGSNLGPTNEELINRVRERVTRLREADPGNTGEVPVDLVTASSSGLDPHISITAANYQKLRVARLNRLPESEVDQLIHRCTTGRFLGVLGEPVVNVLELNLALMDLKNGTRTTP